MPDSRDDGLSELNAAEAQAANLFGPIAETLANARVVTLSSGGLATPKYGVTISSADVIAVLRGESRVVSRSRVAADAAKLLVQMGIHKT